MRRDRGGPGVTAVDAARPAPAAPAGDPFVHEGLLYRGRREYLAGTVLFIRAGLAAREPVLVAVPGPNLEVLRAGLGDLAGQVRLADMTEVGRNPGRIIPGVLYPFLAEHEPHRVRIVVETVWPGRSDVEYPACVQHEALTNAAFTGRDAIVLCPYDTAGLDLAVLADAARTHPVLHQGGQRQASPAYAGPHPVVAAYNQPLPAPPTDADTVVFDSGGLSAVRHIVAEHARRAGLGPARVADLQIAVTEVAANTIDHTAQPGTLRVWRADGHLICEVRDRGHLADPLAGRLPPAVTSERGRGLVLVNHLCDLVRVHTVPGQMTIRLHMRV